MFKQLFVPTLLAALLAACGNSVPANTRADANASAPAQAVADAAPTPAPAAPANDKGEHVFKATCVMCHGTGAGGAPLFGSKDDWAPRIAQGKDTLYTHALHGFTGAKGTMPPKGANASLADDDVKAAVDYMVSKVK
ncbi:MAG: cytochrome c5 family protein [Burkholderiaceae bacterium]|nr:cytochrome c5 family protein [Burkholderiaceae bacterium]